MRVICPLIAMLVLAVPPVHSAGIEGRAYDAVTGLPVEAVVELVVPLDKGPLRLDSPPPHRYVRGQAIYPPDRMSFRIAPSSSDDAFEFHGLAPGPKLIYVRPHRGYAFAYKFLDLEDGDATKYVDFQLERAATLGGSVVDEMGRPVPHATVVLLYAAPEVLDFVLAGGAAREEVQVDAAGAFGFEAVVKPNEPFRLEVYSPEHPSIFSDALTLQVAEHRTGLILRLQEHGFRLLVSVFDKEGRPLSGAPVTLHSQIQPPREVAQSLSPHFIRSGFTDGGGKVEFTGVAPGPWKLSVSESPAGSSNTRRRITRHIQLAPSSTRKEVEVTLRFD